MPRKAPKHAAEALVFASPLGYRYTARDETGKIVYDPPKYFRSRREAKAELRRLWPNIEVKFSASA